MSEAFHPLKGKAGEFRVALDLTNLGDRAWEILTLSQTLGFDSPKFVTHVRYSGESEVWAIILQQFHAYDADSRFVIDVWDDQLDQLRSAIGRDSELSLTVMCNLSEFLEPVAV